MIDAVNLIKEHAIKEIHQGQSGASLYILDNNRILKYADRTKVTEDEVWSGYVKEAKMYEWLTQNKVSFVPQILSNQSSAKEVILVMQRYQSLQHTQLTEEILDQIMNVLVSVHQLPLPEFLYDSVKQASSNTDVTTNKDDNAQINECKAGWRQVLSEHPNQFDFDVIERIAQFIASNQHMISNKRQCLLHGDFHCDNLLIDHGRILICDWQGASIGHPAGDVSFFLSRLSADGCQFSRESIAKLYIKNARLAGSDITEEELLSRMAWDDLTTSFYFWHIYLHKNPTERVRTIYDSMIADVDQLKEMMQKIN